MGHLTWENAGTCWPDPLCDVFAVPAKGDPVACKTIFIDWYYSYAKL